MVAGLVVQLFQVFVEAAVKACTGAGDQEDQRRGAVLLGNAVGELLHRPEVFGQAEFTLRAHGQGVVGLVDVIDGWQIRPQVRWCRGDGRLERVGQRVAIAGRIDIDRQC